MALFYVVIALWLRHVSTMIYAFDGVFYITDPLQ